MPHIPAASIRDCATLADAFHGLAKQPNTGDIAHRLTKGPEGWDAYTRLRARRFRGSLILLWTSAHNAAGAEAWAFAEEVTGGVNLSTTRGGPSIAIPVPSTTLAAIGRG